MKCQWIDCAILKNACFEKLRKRNKTIYCPYHQEVYKDMVDYLDDDFFKFVRKEWSSLRA